MPETKTGGPQRRIALTINPSLDRSMRLLGMTPATDARDGVPADGAQQLASALARYADVVDRAGRELNQLLDRQEWNLIADVLNGCADLWDWSDAPTSALTIIAANVADGHALDGTGDKWFGEGEAGTVAVQALLEKLYKLTPVHGDAIMAAVRHFWRHCGEIDHAEDRWWTPDFRLSAARDGLKQRGTGDA